MGQGGLSQIKTFWCQETGPQSATAREESPEESRLCDAGAPSLQPPTRPGAPPHPCNSATLTATPHPARRPTTPATLRRSLQRSGWLLVSLFQPVR